MGKLDEVKSLIDWLKDLFKTLIAIMVADIAKLFIDDKINLLFYLGVSNLAVGCIVISRKVELHLNELGKI